jgi:hypothetical protein
MNMFEKAYKKTDKGQFTDKIFGLENRRFYNPEYSIKFLLLLSMAVLANHTLTYHDEIKSYVLTT